MTYKEALELNESAAGLDLAELTIEELGNLIDEIPGWDYPLAEDCMAELSARAGINPDEFFAAGDKDYNDLWVVCAESLGIDF